MELSTKISSLNKIAFKLSKKLAKLNLLTIEDLLFYYPFRYEDYSQITRIADLDFNKTNISLKAKLELIANKRSSKTRRIVTEAIVSDGTGQIRLIWFGQPFLTKILKVGEEYYFSGVLKKDFFGWQIISPLYEKIKTSKEQIHTARILPIYHLTAGITQKQLRYLINLVIDKVNLIFDWLPEEIKKSANLIDLKEAIKIIHFPNSKEELELAKYRLKFDELFILQLRAELIRQQIKTSQAPKIKFLLPEVKKFLKKLPFTLTFDQKKVAWEILQDLEKDRPMNRLLEGDVGSGKTVVAGLVINNVISNKFQAVLMAPTEILAQQHFQSLSKYIDKQKNIALLTSNSIKIGDYKFKYKSKNKRRQELLEKIKQNEIDLIIGTHSLISPDIEFSNLGLVIIDEQHRFGVKQRQNLLNRYKPAPHFLSMTATPIPRTFALTMYGDLDLSIIKQKPANRKSIITKLINEEQRIQAYNFVKKQIKQGRQVFVICPLVDDNNKINDKKTVLAEYTRLQKEIFPEFKVGYLHGKLKAIDKDKIMSDFSQGYLDILVSTSVVEVGVDVPNANLIIIEDAERFGLAQLHQFRGRVGRNDLQAYCLLFTNSQNTEVLDRLNFFVNNNDGFKIAEYDLQRRGPGDVYGTLQSGLLNFKIANLQDVDIIKIARDLAKDIDFNKYPQLLKKIEDWELNVHLE